MPDPIAPAATPAAAAAPAPAAVVQTPPADQPPEPSRERSFAERWKALSGEDLSEAADAAETADDAPEGQPEAAAAPSEKSSPKPDAKRTQFEALAKELGFVLDGSSVTVAERADFRQARAKRERELAERERALTERETAAGANDRVKRADSILDALERGDPDGFAQAVGRKDFNELQQDFIRRLADPNYVELRKLQAWKEQQEQERQKSEAEAKQRGEQEQRARALNAYMTTLGETCKSSSNPLVAAMHDDPAFLNAVYRIQEEHWDGKRTVSAEEAIKLAMRGSRQPLESELRGLFDRLSRAFGVTITPAGGGEKPAKNGRKPAPKTAVTPVATTGPGGGSKKPSEMSSLEWRRYATQRLHEAEDE